MFQDETEPETFMLYSADGENWRLTTGARAFEISEIPEFETIFVDERSMIEPTLDKLVEDRPLGTKVYCNVAIPPLPDIPGLPDHARRDGYGWAPSKTPILEGGSNLGEVLEHVKKHGETIWVPDGRTKKEAADWNPEIEFTVPDRSVDFQGDSIEYDVPSFKDTMNDLGFMVSRAGGDPRKLRIRHSPKAAANARKRRAHKHTTYTQLKPIVIEVIDALPSEVRNCVTASPVGGTAYLMNDQLRRALEIFNGIFGKNAHRKIHPFQDLLKLWGDSLEANRAKFSKDQDGQLADFVVWMDGELEARKPPKRTWKSRFKLDIANLW